MGCRDTVASVGIVPKRLPFTTSNTIVHTFRHALALDEHRAKFLPNVWNQPTKKESHIAMPENKSKSLGDLRAKPSKATLKGTAVKDPNRFRTTRSMPAGDLTIWEEEVKQGDAFELGVRVSGEGDALRARRRSVSRYRMTLQWRMLAYEIAIG